MAEVGIASTAPDFRGHGNSAGTRGFVDRFSDYHADLDTVFATLPAGPPRLVLAHSHGALIAFDWLAAKKPDVRAVAVTNPYLALALPVPQVKLWASKVLEILAPRLRLPSGIPATVVSRDPAVVDAYARDPLVFKTATPGWFKEVQQAQARVRGLTEVRWPLLYVYSDADALVSPAANAALAEKLASPDKTVWMRPGEFHEVLNELGKDALIADMRKWLVQRLA
jgi:alpha-beta hydrolase superfamily lysophospholipase